MVSALEGVQRLEHPPVLGAVDRSIGGAPGRETVIPRDRRLAICHIPELFSAGERAAGSGLADQGAEGSGHRRERRQRYGGAQQMQWKREPVA